jgi:hypothetical protein
MHNEFLNVKNEGTLLISGREYTETIDLHCVIALHSCTCDDDDDDGGGGGGGGGGDDDDVSTQL